MGGWSSRVHRDQGGKAKKKENIRVKRGKKQKEVTVPRDAENDY